MKIKICDQTNAKQIESENNKLKFIEYIASLFITQKKNYDYPMLEENNKYGNGCWYTIRKHYHQNACIIFM